MFQQDQLQQNLNDCEYPKANRKFWAIYLHCEQPESSRNKGMNREDF